MMGKIIAGGIIGLLALTIICGSAFFHKKIQVDVFEETVDQLSDEQKCIHICGFRWYGSVYLDQYKFCVEKCDRISERSFDCDKVAS